jgi:hypothetical protein
MIEWLRMGCRALPIIRRTAGGPRRCTLAIVALTMAAALSLIAEAQRRSGFGGGFRGGYGWSDAVPVFDRSEFPNWEVDLSAGQDMFTFVRVKYAHSPNESGRSWHADYPDADFYFSWRLQQLTSLQVNPNPMVLELTDPRLNDYPFLFLSAPQSVNFTEEEVKALRRYLLNGGFMMCDEFFGTLQWALFYPQLKRLFPEFEPSELPLSHEIFHNVYNLERFPQVTAIHFWQRQRITYHPVRGTEIDHAPHFFGIRDSAGRMMMLICHNNDIQDGWEREGEDREFFERFSVQQSYPMGINIITYALTH